MTNSPAGSAARALTAAAAAVSTLVFASIGAASGASEQAERSTPVPILMYHLVSDPPANAPFPQLFVSERDFAGQMRWLARHGYHAVTLRAVWDHWHRGAPLPKRPIVVSFDDGYRSVAHAALPTMRERGWPGVLNFTVKNLRVAGGLSERQIRRLITAGWELDAHTISHPDLTTISNGQLAREVAGSRKALRKLFGVPVDFFCYPGGRYDARVITAVRRAGYLGATTTLDGLGEPSKPYELRRVRVSRSDGVSGLATKLEHLSGS